VLLVSWVIFNVIMGKDNAPDPYPFILLNLILSMIAAIQAPVIMMSQNRQDKKDRLRGELDFAVNRRAASDIQGLAGKLNLLLDKVSDVDDELRALDPVTVTREQELAFLLSPRFEEMLAARKLTLGRLSAADAG
jgi:uncharacterized membrane protein